MRVARLYTLFAAALLAIAPTACSPSSGSFVSDEGQAAELMSINETAERTQSGSNISGDIGSVTYVEIKSTGIGPTPTAAVDEALYSAIRQVNGASISGGSVQYSGATHIQSTFGDVDIASSGFAQALVSQSQGSVTAFSLDEGSRRKLAPAEGKGGDQWQVSISAKIAKYSRPDASMRPALVVAKARVGRVEVNAGTFSETEFANVLKQVTEDAITGTNRFAVVNRDLTDEALSELSIAESASSSIEQRARIGQLLSAEVVVIPTLELVQYRKSVRELRTSDRDLVSFSGALTIRYDVINATTGQTIFSSSYKQSPRTPKATTLGAEVNPQLELEALLAEISSSFVADLNRRTFPVSVIAVDGDVVVLSQGGMSVREGASYRAVRKGGEYFDPQTGQSLGRQEIPIGSISIDRADLNLAYGTLTSSGEVDLAGFKPGDIELREPVEMASVEPVSGPPTPARQAPEEVSQTAAAAGEELSSAQQLAKEPADPDW